MPSTHIGPVLFQTAGDAFVQPTKICVLLWVGSTVAGDQVILRHRQGGELLWIAQTDTMNTYLGATLPPYGLSAPNGFYVERIDNGQVLVYIAER